MAVIDTFLKLLVAQRADRLVLVPEEIPTLFSAENASELPMPVVPADLARRLALEVAGEGQATKLQEGLTVEGTYRTAEGEEFAYEVTSSGTGGRIVMFAPSVEDDPPGATRTAPPLPDHAALPPRSTGPRVHPAPPQADPSAQPTTKVVPAAPQPDPELLATIEQALEADASDLFLSSNKQVQARVNGVLRSIGSVLPTNAQILQLLPGEQHRLELGHSGNVDFAAQWNLSGKSRRFRINLFRHSDGVAAALRPIRDRIPTLDELHLPSDLLQLTTHPSGLVLVTGASGSGKSTTLAALVNYINCTKACHLITIEDPIEFEHRGNTALVHQREVGADVESFSSGLRAALRENPDVILLGEMRDLATISAALTAAETGHLVLSTLHTGNATAAVNRIVDVFPGHQQAHVRVQLASSLRAVVAQRLVPSADQSERFPAIEKLVVTPAVANGIRDGKEHHMQSAMQTGAEEGMTTLERSLAALVRNGRITRDTANRHAADQQALRKLLE